MGSLEVIAAAATTSAKPGGNEDRVLTVATGDGVSGAGVVLCDGVGSSENAAAAAEAFSRLAGATLEAGGDRFNVWGLGSALRRAPIAMGDGETTLIALGAETSGFVSYMLVGNGSVIEVAPTSLPGGGVRLLWSDIALPHIDWTEGRPAVDSVLPVQPAGLRVARGAHFISGESRAFVVCSDGIATLEERAEGAAPDGSTWRAVPAALAQLVERLTVLWGALMRDGREAAQRQLSAGLESLLGELAAGSGLDDDASVGVVVVRPIGDRQGAAAGGEA